MSYDVLLTIPSKTSVLRKRISEEAESDSQQASSAVIIKNIRLWSVSKLIVSHRYALVCTRDITFNISIIYSYSRYVMKLKSNKI